MYNTDTIFDNTVLYNWYMVREEEEFPSGSAGKESACNVGDLGLSLGWEDPLEKGKATHSNTLAWRISWSKSIGSQRVGHDWATFTFTSLHFMSVISLFKLTSKISALGRNAVICANFMAVKKNELCKWKSIFKKEEEASHWVWS